MDIIKNLIKNNLKLIIGVPLGLLFLYICLLVFIEKTEMDQVDRDYLNNLNKKIDSIYQNQSKLDSNIQVYSKEINKIGDTILSIKSQKTIIKEIYHDKINRVSEYNDAQLDSFFAERYGYNPR